MKKNKNNSFSLKNVNRRIRAKLSRFLAFALAGAAVTHVDASKKAINLAFENRNENELEHLPIRFLVEDALNFVKREIRRINKYDGIILDPPKYGRGPNGEKWKIEDDLLNLLELIQNLHFHPDSIDH